MQNVRCSCKKIVCQLEENTIIIKCRHCKRYILIETQGPVHIEYKTHYVDKSSTFQKQRHALTAL
ncbi:hypothetical protein CHY_0353 [Calderihabitans maritimus]|uniref:Com family DNA-binding transcriptional regulator n=1 Tax=Calderihabitans maritimus TaxID=1246530 RepID=A0A1Z5HQ96_9FIRM|nr:hypothetical protein CHY_0353 [Calderihabitans maritimus]